MLVGDASTEGAWDPPMKLVHVQLLVFVDYQTPEFKPALILDYQCYQTFAKPEKGHLNGHLLTFIDDQLVLPVGQKPLLLILRWRRPTLVQVAGGKGAAKRVGGGWRDPPTCGWWEPPTSKMSLSSGGGAAHYGFHRPGWIL